MVALTATATLSAVMTSWRSPVRGVSRMSTRTRRSRNGVMIASPAGTSRLKRPNRVITPEYPCCTTLIDAPRMIATTITMTAMMTPSATSIFQSAPCEWHDHQGRAANLNHHHLRVGRHTARLLGHREPLLTGEARMSGVVLIAHLVDRERARADQAVRRARQRQPRTHAAVGDALQPGSDQQRPTQGDGGERDGADPQGG